MNENLVKALFFISGTSTEDKENHVGKDDKQTLQDIVSLSNKLLRKLNKK